MEKKSISKSKGAALPGKAEKAKKLGTRIVKESGSIKK